MGAVMVSLIEHADDAHTPAATARGLSFSSAMVLALTAVLTTSLYAWRDQPRLYRPLFLTCIGTAVMCLGLGILKPAPVVFVLALVVLFGVPWVYAVVRRVTHRELSGAQTGPGSGESPR
jgi:hypothetical protein